MDGNTILEGSVAWTILITLSAILLFGAVLPVYHGYVALESSTKIEWQLWALILLASVAVIRTFCVQKVTCVDTCEG